MQEILQSPGLGSILKGNSMVKSRKRCRHELYRCVKCNQIGCKWMQCVGCLIKDSCDLNNDNFEHGSDTCLRCGAEASTSDGKDAFIAVDSCER